MVTGSAGRVGSAIYHHLKQQDFTVWGMDVLAGPDTDIVCDIKQVNLIKDQLPKIQAVIHTAALHAPHVGIFRHKDFIATNVNATEQLFQTMMSKGMQHFIFTSTTALYGYASTAGHSCSWITEQSQPLPKTIYHNSKILAENVLQQLHLCSGIPVTILQMSRCFPEPINQMAIYRLHRGIDVHDVAIAHRMAMTQKPPGFQRMILSAQTPFNPSDCQALKQQSTDVIKHRCPQVYEYFKRQHWSLPQSIDRVYDASLAYDILGWRAQHGVDELINEWQLNSDKYLAPQ